MSRSVIKPFLKWAGNKYRQAPQITDKLPKARCLVEPFVGSGAVFLNSEYDHYILNDINPDLINLFKTLQRHGHTFIDFSKQYFTQKNNTPERFYALRELFNNTRDIVEKSALFIYLNRHSYNGLCRYNSKKEFNVPFGRYKDSYFPQEAMENFYNKSSQATFMCDDFISIMNQSTKDCVVYCDPPYVPWSDTAYFTSYSHQEFDMSHQTQLADIAKSLASNGIPVLISNHDTDITRDLYEGATFDSFSVRRYISCKSDGRNNVSELLALFN